MGLQSQINDVSSESLPILFLTIIANLVAQLRSLFFTLFLHLGIVASSTANEALLHDVHHSLLRLATTEEDNQDSEAEDEEDEVDQQKEKCVFCLSGLKNSECISKLTSCRHVFHKDCLDGWIDQMKFSCPLCRSPLVSDWRVSRLPRRVVSRFAAWFAVR